MQMIGADKRVTMTGMKMIGADERVAMTGYVGDRC